MKTDERLTEAYEKARIEYFDDNSKYIIFSDIHRGNGSHFDEFSKNQNVFRHALEYYFEQEYTYIEAGDGDELWVNPKAEDIKNAHFHIFETIKKFNDDNRFVMIYGNHNIYMKDIDYVRKHFYLSYNEYKESNYEFLMGMIPVESLILKHTETYQEILTLHGHQGDFLNDQFWFPTMVSLKYFWRHLHSLGIRNPASPVKNTFKRPREDELPYFNTGCATYPTIVTGIEISDGNIQLVRWKTEPDNEGFLKVTKVVLRGPKPIKHFNMEI